MASSLFYFQAYGLRFASDIAMPEFREEHAFITDVQICRATLPNFLPEPRKIMRGCQFADNQVLIRIPEVATYLIRNGNCIQIDFPANADMRIIRFYLLGIAMSMLFLQRGTLLLHSSAIRTAQGCVLFAAHSGSGKSTLAAACAKRGFEMLADDTSFISFASNGQAQLIAGISHLKLSAESAAQLNIDEHTLNPLFSGQHKYVLPLKSTLLNRAFPIEHIFELNPWENTHFFVDKTQGLRKFDIMRKHTSCEWAIDALGLQAKRFELCTLLHRKVPLSRLFRPQQGFRLDPLVDYLVDKLNLVASN